MTARVAVVTSGFPRVSETFALNELVALQARGMLAGIFATKPGDWSRVQPQVVRLRDAVRVLPDGDVDEQADAVVHWLDGSPVSAVHGYFAHRPAAVAARAADRLGVPFGFSAHALDVRKVPRSELARRAGRARGVVTCNTDTAAALALAGVAAHMVPHGVDVTRFAPATAAEPHAGFRVLAVGRLVEKKGFSTLLRAVALVDGDVTLRIVGAGRAAHQLGAEVRALGLGRRVALVGPRLHDELPEEYAGADVVAVPSVVDPSGDRDGLPNVVLEAMACGRAVVASEVGAIPDAIVQGVTGLLVPPGAPGPLADALGLLRDDPTLRRRLGDAARHRTLARYDLRGRADALCRHLDALYG